MKKHLINIIIDKDKAGKTVKDILTRHYNVSSRLMAKLKRENLIFVNGLKAYVVVVLREGDLLEVVLPKENSENIIPKKIDLNIVFEDEDLMVVNKQAGISVHPCAADYYGTLGNGVAYQWQQQGKSYVFRPVNRLDKDTSGLMIIAKSQYVHHQLSKQFDNNQLNRTYCAVVHGIILEDTGAIDAPIERKPGSVLERMVSPDGQKAVTHYKVLNRGKFLTLLELKLDTGRTHQIRVHMSHIGHPLVGDWLYGSEDRDIISRHALHSKTISFMHPISKRNMEFASEIPDDIKNLL